MEMIKPQLTELRMRTTKQQCSIKYIVVDNCCHSRGSIHQVFSEKDDNGSFITTVVKDVKLLINHPLEEVMKMHKLYASFVAELHGAVTNGGRKIKAMSRNGDWSNVEAHLDSGQVIWGRLVSVVEENKGALAKAGDNNGSLFLKDFVKEFQEVYDCNGKHYYEGRADMDFHLFRGTDCNEAWHHKLNSIYALQCGE